MHHPSLIRVFGRRGRRRQRDPGTLLLVEGLCSHVQRRRGSRPILCPCSATTSEAVAGAGVVSTGAGLRPLLFPTPRPSADGWKRGSVARRSSRARPAAPSAAEPSMEGAFRRFTNWILNFKEVLRSIYRSISVFVFGIVFSHLYVLSFFFIHQPKYNNSRTGVSAITSSRLHYLIIVMCR